MMATNRDFKDNDKANVMLEEYATGTKDCVEGVVAERDGFGARKKVDPKEIKLVRKIDWYMMVRAGPTQHEDGTKRADTQSSLFSG